MKPESDDSKNRTKIRKLAYFFGDPMYLFEDYYNLPYNLPKLGNSEENLLTEIPEPCKLGSTNKEKSNAS